MQSFSTVYDLQNTLMQARLQGKWGAILLADVFHDGLYITVTEGSVAQGQEALSAILGNAFSAEEGELCGKIRLGSSQELPVYCDNDESESEARPFELRPLLRDIALLNENSLPEYVNDIVFKLPADDGTTPKLTAFFSFKGGVGRTLHLTALTHFLGEQLHSDYASPKILLIDADIEAPGITWWTKEMLPPTPYSFLDLLGDALEGVESAANKAVDHVRAMRLSLGSSRASCFVLPLFRNEIQLLRPPVLPERLTLASENPWVMGELLLTLGKKLGVQHILVDLRAGLTELSSPLFLDPRARRVLVSTTSSQSVQGTVLALRELAKFAAICPETIRTQYADNTKVLLGFIPKDIAPDITANITAQFEEFLEKLTPQPTSESDSVDVPSWFIYSEYDQSLLGLGTFEAALDALKKSQTIQRVCELLSPKEEIKASSSTFSPSDEKIQQDAKILSDKLSSSIFADNQDASVFLVTDAYRRLASTFLTQIPNAVIMGAKGSGKTFFFKVLSTLGSWQVFCGKCGLAEAHDTTLIPLYWSQNIKERSQLFTQQQERISVFNQQLSPDIGDKAEKKLRDVFGDSNQTKTPSEWRELWYAHFCHVLGSTKEPPSYEQHFKELTKQLTGRITFIVDGLEDLFSAWLKSTNGIEPLRVLLQELVRDISSLSDNRIGLLLFIRKDIVQRAIGQNTGQFMSLYAHNELRWSKEEALRLVGWALAQCELKNYRGVEPDGEWGVADYQTMAEGLRALWGEKLGGDKTKEAFTVNWVLSAISDFKGNFQARDILRLLFEAAKAQSLTRQIFPGRLLSPAIVRKALGPCGAEKIAEIKQEIPILADDLQKLETKSPRVPISPDDLKNLQLDNLQLFEEFGLFFRDGTEYYLPEIYRQGLRLDLTKGGRSKVVYLMRKALANAGIAL